jgi:hypothetical protein
VDLRHIAADMDGSDHFRVADREVVLSNRRSRCDESHRRNSGEHKEKSHW